MLRTRLWMGALLIVLAVGVLVVDQWLEPWFPFLFLLLLALAGMACHELLGLLPATRRPVAWLCYAAVGILVASNWIVHRGSAGGAWTGIAGAFAAVVLAAFLVEMANFQTPGESIVRIALTVWIAAYLGLLPCFLAQLRWSGGTDTQRGTLALALAIFVPKCCDIGAYFTGRFLGKHRMAPVLSPKKTWEGAAGGIVAAVAATAGINRLGPVLDPGWTEIGFGVSVGVAGMLGDLAESLIKRDCQRKDASQAVPGFGGVLDVVDAVIFAAPVAYVWIHGPLAA